MRVATSTQMAAIDNETIAGGTPGLELMERAGAEMVRVLFEIVPDLPADASLAFVCGKGNNAGDGLVMARMLTRLGLEVTVMLLANPDDMSSDARTNFDRLEPTVTILKPAQADWAMMASLLCDENDVVIDAVFGTGVKTPVRGEYCSLFEALDRRRTTIISLDVPSGVDGDTGVVEPTAVRADATITVGLPKLGLLLHPGRNHVGSLSVVDIGFPDDACTRHTDELYYLLPEDLAELLPERPGDVHKYAAGSCLVMAGSLRFGGAAILAAGGALRSGAGMVTLGLPDEYVNPALISVPEVLVRGLPTTNSGTLAPVPADDFDSMLQKQDAWAVGSGFDADGLTDRWVIDSLARIDKPVVVDADALTAFVRQGCDFICAAEQVILTPHAGELARFAGVDPEDLRERRFDTVREAARRWNCILVAKGAPTLIANPDGTLVINGSGDDALAHGGTGDVLTGLLGGLLAQGLPAMDAAQLGCWLHGRAGELSCGFGSKRTLRAGDVIAHLPTAMGELSRLRGEDGIS